MSENKKITPKLIVLSAPSGAGKSSIAAKIIENHKDTVKLSISYTTRKPRGTEKNGVHYFFVDEPTFKKMIENDQLLEYAMFAGHWYGTSKNFVETTLKENKSILFDIDVQGAESIKSIYQNKCVTFFIHPPSFEILEQRLRARKTDLEEAIQLRLQTAKKELSVAHKFDYQVTNFDLNATYLEIEKILLNLNCI